MEFISSAGFFIESLIFNKKLLKKCSRWSDCGECPGPATHCSSPACQGGWRPETPAVIALILHLTYSEWGKFWLFKHLATDVIEAHLKKNILLLF